MIRYIFLEKLCLDSVGNVYNLLATGLFYLKRSYWLCSEDKHLNGKDEIDMNKQFFNWILENTSCVI